VRLTIFGKHGQRALAVRDGETLIDMAAAGLEAPADISAILRSGPDMLREIATAAAGAPHSARIAAADVSLMPLSLQAGKIVCLGLNYADHAAEANLAAPEFPTVFFRSATSLVGHGQAIHTTPLSSTLDYEGELVAFIGRTGRDVPLQDALAMVAGYSVFNDGSVREYQAKSSQWTVGKNFDATGGFGPDFVTADELPPGATGLAIETRLNGQTMQSANTSDMIFDVASTIALLSQCFTLEAGDLLVMGTPSGVGAARDPTVFMRRGDVCEVEIELVGLLSNPIADRT
jgi:acylpyruvate hydrolase